MNLKRSTILASICFLLMSCDESFDGSLSLQQQITLKQKKGADLIIPMGQHQAEVKAKSSKIKLEITLNGQEQEIEFKLPKDHKIRSFNDLNLQPAQSGQPYALKGHEHTDYRDSEPTRGTESCSYTTVENRCGYETTPRTCHNETHCSIPGNPHSCRTFQVCHGGESVYVCRNVQVTHYGSKNVEYYLTHATTDRKVQIIDPNSQQSIGLFSNRTHKTTKNYLYEGSCIADRPW